MREQDIDKRLWGWHRPMSYKDLVLAPLLFFILSLGPSIFFTNSPPTPALNTFGGKKGEGKDSSYERIWTQKYLYRNTHINRLGNHPDPVISNVAPFKEYKDLSKKV